MRKTVLLLASMALAVLLASGVALAATITCPNRDGDLCVGTDQADTLNGRVGASDLMQGRGGDDTLRARGGDDKLTGGLGRDTLNGALGSDTYRFGDRWRHDTIVAEDGGVDTLDFSAVPQDLLTHTYIPIWLTPRSEYPEASLGSSPDSPATLNFTQDIVIEDVRGSSIRDDIHGNSASNQLYGNDGKDSLSGEDGNDTLVAGVGNDDMSGGPGNDTMIGGKGRDSYYYPASLWGHDTITDTAALANNTRYQTLSFNNGITSGNMTINLVSSEAPEVTHGTSTIDWEDNALNDVFLADTNDTIDGNDAANFIGGGGGVDTIRAAGGNDKIYVHGDSPQSGNNIDTVDCGPGDDVVYTDGPDTLSNCETVIIA